MGYLIIFTNSILNTVDFLFYVSYRYSTVLDHGTVTVKSNHYHVINFREYTISIIITREHFVIRSEIQVKLKILQESNNQGSANTKISC